MNDRENQEVGRQLLFALSHPLRQEILKELAATAELSPQECSQRLKAQLSHASYHFRELAKCKAIALVRTEPVRGTTKHYYRFAIEEPWALEALGLALPPESP
jgi:DNA-binding transcriptional ArsR family regulator